MIMRKLKDPVGQRGVARQAEPRDSKVIFQFVTRVVTKQTELHSPFSEKSHAHQQSCREREQLGGPSRATMTGGRYYRKELDEEDDDSRPKGLFAQLLEDEDGGPDETPTTSSAPASKASPARSKTTRRDEGEGRKRPRRRYGDVGIRGDRAASQECEVLLIKTVQARRNQMQRPRRATVA